MLLLDNPELFPEKVEALKLFIKSFNNEDFKISEQKQGNINQLSCSIRFQENSNLEIAKLSNLFTAFAMFHGFYINDRDFL